MIDTRSASDALVLALTALKMATARRHRLRRDFAEYVEALEIEAKLNAEILDLALRMDWARTRVA